MTYGKSLMLRVMDLYSIKKNAISRPITDGRRRECTHRGILFWSQNGRENCDRVDWHICFRWIGSLHSIDAGRPTEGKRNTLRGRQTKINNTAKHFNFQFITSDVHLCIWLNRIQSIFQIIPADGHPNPRTLHWTVCVAFFQILFNCFIQFVIVEIE